ncbi:hypothetical protein Pan216_43010 [Planctomycetes bacterium Pan216]|uniref:Type VI secretion protein, VC_A0111 family n=1 Tax=Kolteria novifilia TaxID=2527975 RepID=A0A518B8Y0_9BACT|nr:hypothetical protein Pan216_43010 [Planctomycetes bacterium Pan216]
METEGRRSAAALTPIVSTSTTARHANGGTTPSPATAELYAGPSVEQLLYDRSHRFDFFQAVRLFERLYPGVYLVGRGGPPNAEAVRFRNSNALAFPSNTIQSIAPPSGRRKVPMIESSFLGLTGQGGVLPSHYTELMLAVEREAEISERHALRDWFDLFNNRLIAVFYWSWEKYRFYIPYERREFLRPEPDPFTRGVYSVIGLGTGSLRSRLHVRDEQAATNDNQQGILAEIFDVGLVRYAGLLSQRPPSALGLESLLSDYFQLPVSVHQFEGQWLAIERPHQTRLGVRRGNNQLGHNAVAGEKVWNVEAKIRVRVGPLDFNTFNDYLPDRSSSSERKNFFLLVKMIRLYAGLELDVDVQLVLKGDAVPESQLSESDDVGPRLGWNVWVRSQDLDHDADDAVFAAEDVTDLARL